MGTMVLQPVVSHITEALTLYSREQADPKPEKIRPRTITQKPGVKVWMAPPTAKTTAPLKSVPRLPMISPTCPAATDVTAQKEVSRNIVISQNSALLGFACEANAPKAPISRTATIVPTSTGPGSLKYFRKCGPVITPDITLALTHQVRRGSRQARNVQAIGCLPLIVPELEDEGHSALAGR